jgi:hypothetical protein
MSGWYKLFATITLDRRWELIGGSILAPLLATQSRGEKCFSLDIGLLDSASQSQLPDCASSASNSPGYQR